MNSLDAPSTRAPTLMECVMRPRTAFIIIFIQSLLQALPSLMVAWGSVFSIMAFDSLGISDDPLDTRGVWFWGWLAISVLMTTGVFGVLITSMALTTGAVWIQDREEVIEKQAHRLKRLTIPSMLIPALAGTVLLIIGALGLNPPCLVVALWLLLTAVCARGIYRAAEAAVPSAPGEHKGAALSFGLLLGSIFQFFMTAIIAGTSPSVGKMPSSSLTVLKDIVGAVACWVGVASGAFGVVIALELLFSNRKNPVVPQMSVCIKMLSRAHSVLFVIGGPFTLLIDALIFTYTYHLSLTEFKNIESWLTQPAVSMLLLATLVHISNKLQDVWSDSGGSNGGDIEDQRGGTSEKIPLKTKEQNGVDICDCASP